MKPLKGKQQVDVIKKSCPYKITETLVALAKYRRAHIEFYGSKLLLELLAMDGNDRSTVVVQRREWILKFLVKSACF